MRVVSVLLLLFCTVVSFSADTGFINVADYGAVPNDNRCDADAISKAVAAAKRIELRPGSYVEVSRGLYFPPGVYDISRTVKCHKGLALFSNPGKAIIRAKADADGNLPDVMFEFFSYTNSVRNLKFLGGKTQLLFTNPNINQSTVEISSCEFLYATGIAVKALPSGKADHLSMLLTIRNCKFLSNRQCMETYCDYTVLNDCWVEVSQPMMIDGPVFVNRAGHLFFDRVMGIPCADKSKGIKNLENCRWVDNYSSFTAVNSRFGAEGAGIPVVYQYEPVSVPYPHVFKGGTVDIRSSYVFTGSQRRKNACVIMLHALPQFVVFDANIGPANNALFHYGENYSPAAMIEKLRRSKKNTLVKYVIGHNLVFPGQLEKTVPEELKQFIRQK